MKKILDIFEKTNKTRMKKKAKKIIADYREKNSLVLAELVSLGINVEIKHLPVADFIIQDTAIERKTISDFISSMINKRLLRQLEELKQFPKPLLIIEGREYQEIYNDEKEGINGNAIRGFLLHISLEQKIPIIFTKNEEDTAIFISLIAKKQEKNHQAIRAKKKSRNKKEQLQFLLEGFPGIGPSTAKKLLKEYKTLKAIINTPLEDLQKLIGKKADIFKLIEQNY